ncbi:MAG: ankyrin repeat domain-containing protein [Gammaproteobacteria bacterium]|nr:ankyrin repeat domain-containing protein [Gammaproteobacteria bacterium]
MSLADEIIQGRHPQFAAYVQAGDSLDDIDEYGFTPLIETILMHRPELTAELLKLGVNINKPDMAGRTALQWAVDNEDKPLLELLLQHQADANNYTLQGFSALVYPILRQDEPIKQLLLRHGANLNFAQDFIAAKLLGHRFSLTGTADLVTPKGEMIEIDYEGFVLEFTVGIIKNSFTRFIHHFTARKWRDELPLATQIIQALVNADKLLRFQRWLKPNRRFQEELATLLEMELLILPAASSGHAMGFIKYKDWLIKIDRGENSLKEGSINVYEIGKTRAFDVHFLDAFMFRRQPRQFFHEGIHKILDLKKLSTLPMSSQISGNCSWANIEACIAVSHWVLSSYPAANFEPRRSGLFYQAWLKWDQDRAIEEIIDVLPKASKARQLSLASMLTAVLFQFLNANILTDTDRAERILKLIVQENLVYILQSYLDIYCQTGQKTFHGDNLLQLLDNCGYDPNRLGLMFT